jgi:hypothetical protein
MKTLQPQKLNPVKKQHYIPKFLLRNFSSNSERTFIGVFLPVKNFFKADSALNSQAQENYFYGSDGVMEDSLGEVENQAALAIKDIMSKQIPPKKRTIDYTWLLMFTMDQIFRTKGNAEDTMASLNEQSKYMAQFDPELSKINWDELRIDVENPATKVLGSVADKLYMMADLELKLLVNKTSTTFIISDDPVIKYNQFLEYKKHPCYHTSMPNKGIQLFFPITPTLMLMYYDKWAYEIGKDNTSICLTNKYDIDKLNALQLTNCNNAIYFGYGITQDYLSNLFMKYAEVRKISAPQLQHETFVYKKKRIFSKSPVGGNKLINLNLSFVKLTKKALKYEILGMVIPYRNESLRSLLIDKISMPEEVIKNILKKHPPIVID